MARLALAAAALGGVYLAVLLHEVGHALAGRSQGFRFLFLAVGPLWVERHGGRTLVRLNRVPATWGGVSACLPEDGRDLVRRMAVMAAGGPAASLAVAALAGLALLAVPGGGHPLRHLLLGLALGSAAVFCVTAQAFGAGGGFLSDGGRVRALLGGGPLAAREAAALALTAASSAGVRPRDWPEAAARDALAVRDGSALELGGAMLVYAWHLDRGEVEAAAGHLARARSLAARSGLARDALETEAAFFEAFVRGDAAAGRAALPARPGAFVEAYQWHRARAAVALAEGDRAAALAEAGLGEAALERPRFQRASAMDREQLQAIRDRAAAEAA